MIIEDGSDEGGHRAYWWRPLMASSSGGHIHCVPKVFVSVFFLRPIACVTRGIRFSIRKRSICWLCCVCIENSYNTCVKSTPS